ncbi:hypothetical protein AB0H36_27490 [Kribbella sp. NPDC050820]|uniref:hypothetical protein n=1 Tax=Kribbella sp. NPDC050820 TaxID=3155408 RepID=UPI0033E79B24
MTNELKPSELLTAEPAAGTDIRIGYARPAPPEDPNWKRRSRSPTRSVAPVFGSRSSSTEGLLDGTFGLGDLDLLGGGEEPV